MLSKPYCENPNYLVYEDGTIFSLYTNRKIKVQYDKQGYNIVKIKINGKTATRRVHRMVALCFIPNPDNLPQVNHKDEDKNNNNVANLEWVTAKQNCNYGTRNIRLSQNKKGRPKNYKQSKVKRNSKPIQQLNLNGEIINSFPCAGVACEQLGWPQNRSARIRYVANGHAKTAYGFLWRFHEEGCIKQTEEDNNSQSLVADSQ